MEEFLKQQAAEVRKAREQARQTERAAEAARRKAVETGTDEDKKTYGAAVEEHRQARFDLGQKQDDYHEASQAHNVVRGQRDEEMYQQARAKMEEDQANAALVAGAEKEQASQVKQAAKNKAAMEKHAADAAARAEKDAAAGIEKRNERRLMHMTLGAAGEQAAQGGVMNMVGAGMKVAGSGALGETMAAMAGGPEAAAAMAAFQIAKAAVDAAVARAQSVAPYSGAVQAANAVAQARTTMADINEAGRMGGTYATLIDSQSRLENSARSAFDPIRDALIQHITDFLESYADIAEDLQPILDLAGEFIGGGIRVWSFINTLPIKLVAGLISAMAEWFDDENGKKKKTSANLFEGIDEAIKAMHTKANQKDIRQPTDATAAAGIPMGFPAWSKP